MRIPLWRKCHKILWEDQPYTFMFRRETTNFIDKRIANVGLAKPGYLNFHVGGAWPSLVSWGITCWSWTAA